MSIARILAVLDGTPRAEAALASALALGRSYEAAVTVLHVELDSERSLPLLAEGMTPAMLSELAGGLAAEAKRATEASEKLFDRLCRQAHLPLVEASVAPPAGKFSVTWQLIKGVEADSVMALGRLHDLIVLPHPAAGEEGVSSPTLEAALFDTGRLVLLPGAVGVKEAPRHVAVAWNASRESARAVALALPLLKKATQVTVLTGQRKDGGAKPSELAAYLAQHGIPAATWSFLPDDWPVAGSLVAEAKKAGAQALVMGAYGHSRLRELVLGGATRAALRQSDLPLILAH